MNSFLGDGLEQFLIAFCRISGFMLLLPGFASLRVPMQIRLYIAVAVAIVLAPNLKLEPSISLAPWFLAIEITIGLVLGIMVRVYFLALNFTAVTIGSFIGLAAMPGVPVETDEAQ
ncbi:MAG: flagellar biosynthetic protein FliR, partial [Notoacmeibacter sp.]